MSEVPVSNDVKEQVKKAEHRKNNGNNVVHKFPQNGTLLHHHHDTIMEEPISSAETVGETQRRRHFKSNNKKSKWHTKNSLVRALNGSLRRAKTTEKRNGIVLKTVEIHREGDITLGIYIKQIKRQYKGEVSPTPSKSSNMCIIISRLVPGSLAYEQGVLKPGDEIVSINDVDIESMDLKMVAAIMDLPKVLLLVVRSAGTNFGLNNNLDSKNYIETGSLKNGKSNKTNPIEEVIPSVYDNNGIENPFLSTTITNNHKEPITNHKIQNEYDEAFQALLNAINDLEQVTTPTVTEKKFVSIAESGKNTNTNNSRPSSYWDELNNWIRPSDIGKSREKCSAIDEDLPWEESILHQIPHFPIKSIHSINEVEDPDYDEVTPSVFGDESEELQVDGYAKHWSQVPRGLSSSNDSMSSNASTGFYATHYIPSKSHRASKYNKHSVKLKKSFSVEAQSSNTADFKSLRSTNSENGGKIGEKVIVYPESQSNVQHKNSGVTVAKRQEWFNKGQKVSNELKQRLEGSTSCNTKSNNINNEKPRTSSESSGTSLKSNPRKSSSNSQSNTQDSKCFGSNEEEDDDIIHDRPIVSEDTIVPKSRTGKITFN